MTNIQFTAQNVDASYVNALVELVNACQFYGVEIDKVSFYQNGWHVIFKDFPEADAICHDGSMGSPCYNGIHRGFWEVEEDYYWETMGFPWDGDDVSVHSSRELVFYIYCANLGVTPWGEDE